jgi:hypothetical protein
MSRAPHPSTHQGEREHNTSWPLLLRDPGTLAGPSLACRGEDRREEAAESICDRARKNKESKTAQLFSAAIKVRDHSTYGDGKCSPGVVLKKKIRLGKSVPVSPLSKENDTCGNAMAGTRTGSGCG